jgi:hypothetical protein
LGISKAEAAFEAAFRRVHMFPNLKVMRLDFSLSNVQDASLFDRRQKKLRAFQRAVVYGFTSGLCPQSLKGLALLDLASDLEASYTEPFFEIVGNLTALSPFDLILGDLTNRESLSTIWIL